MGQKETESKVVDTSSLQNLLGSLMILISQSKEIDKGAVCQVQAFLSSWFIAESTDDPVQYLDCLKVMVGTAFHTSRPSFEDEAIGEEVGYYPIRILDDLKDSLMTAIVYSKKSIQKSYALNKKYDTYYQKHYEEKFKEETKNARVEARVKCLKEMKGRLLLVADDGNGFYALDKEALRLVREYVNTRLDSIKNKPEPEAKAEPPYMKGTDKLIKALSPFFTLVIK